jgi:hypothetical protein
MGASRRLSARMILPRGCVNETADAMPPGLVGQLHRGQRADLPCELGIEIAAGIIGDRGQMDDAFDTVQRNGLDEAHVALNYLKSIVRGQEVAEPLRVEANDLVAARQQLRDQDMAFVAAATGDQHFHQLMTPS